MHHYYKMPQIKREQATFNINRLFIKHIGHFSGASFSADMRVN